MANGKKTKIIFVSAEQSKAKETVNIFRQIYDNSPKAYPNRYMMLFITLLEGHQPTPESEQKCLITYNFKEKKLVFLLVASKI